MDRDMMHMREREREMKGMYMNPELVLTVNDCEATCEHMIHHLTMMKLTSTRIAQVSLLRDCSDICGLAARFLARESYFSKVLADVCAEICNACGKECERFPDEMSHHCAEICFNCAKHCRQFARNQ